MIVDLVGNISHDEIECSSLHCFFTVVCSTKIIFFLVLVILLHFASHGRGSFFLRAAGYPCITSYTNEGHSGRTTYNISF